jgi:hypothetical protein
VAACVQDKADLGSQIQDLNSSLTAQKVVLADTIARLNANAAVLISMAQKKVEATEKAARDSIAGLESVYLQTAKERNDARDALIQIANTDPGNPGTTTGLWVYVESATCTRSGQGISSAGGSPMRKAAGDNPAGGRDTQCRLSPKTAVPLIQLASEADEITLKLNLCLKESGVIADVVNSPSNQLPIATPVPDQPKE